MGFDTIQGEDRRQTGMDLDLPATLCPYFSDDTPVWKGRVLSMSRFGLNLLSDRRFERDTLLQIKVRNGNEAFTVLAEVMHIFPQPTGRWSLACRFLRGLSEYDLEDLLAE
jgi:hypothetical protein